MLELVKHYYVLIKPGIIRGNVLAAVGAFLLASKGSIDVMSAISMITGLSLVIASACVANNIFDRDIDRLMDRTKHRALVIDAVPTRLAVLYSAVLGISGVTVLLLGTNVIAACTAVLGFVSYVFVYGYAKRLTVHGTVIGSVSGAIPPVVGYVAVTGTIDTLAVLLFAVLVAWQMPHFYAIALYRKKDYAAARIPVLPLISGDRATVVQILTYIIAFIVVTFSIAFYGYTGIVYAVSMLLVSVWWFVFALRGFTTSNITRWARQVFGISLLVLLTFCVTIGLEAWLP